MLVMYLRKNHNRCIDSLNASLEAEQQAKSEALRIKKKLEGDINELEIALDHSNRVRQSFVLFEVAFLEKKQTSS